MDIKGIIKNNKCAVIDTNNYRARMLYLVNGKPRSFANERYYGIISPESRLSDIYKARIQRVVPSLGGAFVELEDGVRALLPFETKESFCEGDYVLVQVKQDAYDEKDCKVSRKICFLSDKVLYFPTENCGVGKSRYLSGESSAISKLLDEYSAQTGGAFVLRRASYRFSDKEILAEAKALFEQWCEVCEAFKNRIGMGKLCGFGSVCDKFLLNVIPNVDILFTNDSKIAEYTQKHYRFIKVVRLAADDLLDFRFLDADIEQVVRRKIQLPNGATMVFYYTEACCFVDVNSGSILGDNAEDTCYKVNCDCADELMRQLSLRNIGGAVIVDFITMRVASHKTQLIQRLKDQAIYDFNRIQVFPHTTHLGMVELTRARTDEKTENRWVETCEECGGMGKVLNCKFFAYRLLGEFRNLVRTLHPKSITLYITEALLEETKRMNIYDMLKELYPQVTLVTEKLESEVVYDYRLQL